MLVENILKVVGCEDEELMSANANKDATVFSIKTCKDVVILVLYYFKIIRSLF